MALLPTATHVHRLLEAAEGDIGRLVDRANWTGQDRDAQLASIGALAETSHAKCTARADGSLDTDDFRQDHPTPSTRRPKTCHHPTSTSPGLSPASYSPQSMWPMR